MMAAALGLEATVVPQIVEALEVRFLGNRDDRVSFALITDLADAASERTFALGHEFGKAKIKNLGVPVAVDH